MMIASHSSFSVFVLFIIVLGALSLPSQEQMGSLFFDSYRFEDALKSLRDIRSTKSLHTLRQLKDYYLSQGDVASAIEVQREICLRVPKNVAQLKIMIQLHEWENREVEALQWKEKLARLLPFNDQRQLYREIFLGYQALHEDAEAERVAQILKQFKDQDTYLALINFFGLRNDLKEVIGLNKSLGEMNPDDAATLEDSIAMALEEEGRLEEAVRLHLKRLGREAYFLDEEWLAGLSSDQLQAQRFRIERVLALYEQMARYELVAKGQLHLYRHAGMNRYDLFDSLALAIKHRLAVQPELMGLVAASKSAEAHAEAASLLGDNEDFSAAAQQLERAIELSPAATRYYQDLTYFYERLQQFRKAYETQRRLLKVLTQGKEAKGVFYIQRSETLVAQLGKSAANDQVKATRLKMIELLTTLKDDEALMRELEQYNRDYPHDTTMLKELAYRYSAQGREDDAAPLFQRIYQMNPNDPDAISFLLDEKVRDGEGEEALEWLDVHRGSFTPEDYRVRAISLAYDADPTRLKALCQEPLPPEHEPRILCLIHQGRIKEAKRVLKPEESLRDRVTIAYLLLEEGDDEGARRHIEILEKRGGLTAQERRGLKRFLAEVERNHRRERAFVIEGEATFFDSSADYDFRSERVELARKVTGPWHFGVELYEQKYKSRGKYNVGPVLYYRQSDYFLRYHYGITQNSHLLSYRRQLTPALSGALHAGRGTPFTDLFTVSFRTDVRQRPLTAELDYFKGRHSAALTFENNLYSFDSGHDSVGRNQTLASYRYTHKNRIFQEVGLVDIRYDAEEIADVTFADLTYGYYKLGYHYKKAPWEVIPAASAGKDFNANEGFGSIVGYELTLVRDTGPDRRIQLTLEHRNIGQQNIKQDTNVAYLSFIHWLD